MKVEFSPEFEKSFKRLIWRERLAPINPKEYYRKIQYFIQRGRRGYSDADLWNANDHIARTVLAFLDHNATCKMAGYLAGTTEGRWESYKTEIRWLMEQQLSGWDVPVEVAASEAYQKRLARANRIFGQYWSGLWD